MRGLLISCSRTLIRPFSSSTRNLVNRVAEKQKLFQEKNDLPVHLKGGPQDNLLYRLTMAICLGGTTYGLFCLGWASFPHKK
ncbi:cytochrome c oxidase subunit 7A1, mitochondrial-like isoform X3 [Antechinus flavipes]|uniref:cytochrome c oxidase subunit 7A1, mitochondrial-like isoform X1 n=1 Tax=Antechinus flavipes TaxID=38775 RepID=UPI0022355F48|nr:cytochrome c oxidase subunit 7A1, mitochondrial-like isoform X1 [Antechinus flavipes]XP_051844863.1 cytochrome c oxidase subunit 7A1, mitochondrial-like isoform X2 [Antechinus flavipes]XP_051844864.1 cytochrome c oxidase subunit 7A1, mitochondrial-like isoform X3 [Antechinus flavipes]